MAEGPVAGVAISAIDALKTSPVLLLIVLLNMAFAGSAAYYLAETENKRNEGVRLILDRCLPASPPRFEHDRRDDK